MNEWITSQQASSNLTLLTISLFFQLYHHHYQAFQITTTASSSAAKTSSNIVIGQVYDDASMSFLQRLGNLPTNKGLKGVIPGQDSGPPLLKVYVRNVEIKQQEVSSTSSSSE